MDRWDNSSKASEWKDLISKVCCKVCSQSHMTAINGTGCRAVISAGKSCLSGVACLPKCQYTLTPKSWQTKTSCCHTRDMFGKSAWWKVSEKQRREEKKLCQQYTGIIPSSGSIMVLTVLVTGWIVLQCMQHHPSKVEQVWAEHLGSNKSWTFGVPLSVDTCHWLSHMLWCCDAGSSAPAGFIWIHRDSWSSPTHHQPPFCCLSEICFHWVWGSDVKYKLPIRFILSQNLEA